MQQFTSEDLALEFARVLDDVLAHASGPEDPEHVPDSRKPAMAVAFSGGLDSTVLLHLAKAYAAGNSIPLFAFHVHHGLNVKADEWSGHCRNWCEEQGIGFDLRHVTVRVQAKEGPAAVARRARYDALLEMADRHGAQWLLLAHHEDDQAETVLMRLLRGAGVAGLSGMEVVRNIPQTGVKLLRPLLGVSRQTLENWAKDHALVHVVDDSNTDPKYARNAFRHGVVPHLSEFSPGFAGRIHRSALHMQSAGRLLDDLAKMDLEFCQEEDALNLAKMASLGPDRFDNLFRFWMGKNGLLMPSATWLKSARYQLLHAKEDAQPALDIQGALIRRYRNHLFFERADEKKQAENGSSDGVIALVWQGEATIPVPEFGGRFIFASGTDGIDALWLQKQQLRVAAYRGQSRIRVSSRRPGKTLKALYQELGVPAWERRRLPLLFAGDILLFAAGIGPAADHVDQGIQRIRIGWEFDENSDLTVAAQPNQLRQT